MHRILCFCEKWESGGIEAFLTGVYEHMDLSDLEIDIVACQYTSGIYDERLARLGLGVRVLSGSVRNLRRNLKLYRDLLARGRYDVVHLNLYEGIGLLFASEARRAGISRVIIHSHNTDLHPGALRSLKLMAHRVFVHRYAGQSDIRWAPSAAAAQFLFGDLSWTLLPNGIELERFAFDAATRADERALLGVSAGQLLVGCVGRLCTQKNQVFLINVLENVPRAVLLLIGEGEDELTLRARVSEKHLTDRVIFAGAMTDVTPFYSAMDALCVPSLFEGLGIVAIEGQAAGLPVFCSLAVPPEAGATGFFEYHKLDCREWADRLNALKLDCDVRECLSQSARGHLAEAEYDIRATSSRVAASYCGDADRGCFGRCPVTVPVVGGLDFRDMGGSVDNSLSGILVSIIVPVYQVVSYLAECLDSLLAQTHANLEIILVDDGSTDGSSELCDAYAGRDGRIRVIHQENAGLSAARNAGLDAALGSYLSFVDSDDAVNPFFIEMLLRLHADIAQCGFCTNDDELMRVPDGAPDALDGENVVGDEVRLTGRDTCEALARDKTGAYTVVWNKLFRRELFETLRFPEGKQHEDEFVTWKTLWAAHSVAVLNIPLYFYRQRSESIMGRGVTNRSLDAIEALQERRDFYCTHGDDQLKDLTTATLCHRMQMVALARHGEDGMEHGFRAALRTSLRGALRSPYVALRSKVVLAVRALRLLHRRA